VIATRKPVLAHPLKLRGFWIIKDPDLDVALELATDGPKACNRKVEVQRYAAKDVGCAYGPA
jgi:hypothetical protein